MSDDDFSMKSSKVIGGVSAPWLMKAFRIGRQHMDRKLRGLKPIGEGMNGTVLYDLAEAAQYLVTPKIDIEAYIRNLGPEALPERLREAFWSSKLKEQNWMTRAGDLWRTEVVLDRVSTMLQSMRDKLRIIPDMVERETGLTSEQRKIMIAIVDDVQQQIYDDLLTFAEQGSTPNQLGEELGIERNNEDLI